MFSRTMPLGSLTPSTEQLTSFTGEQGITFEKVRRLTNRSPKMMISTSVASDLLN